MRFSTHALSLGLALAVLVASRAADHPESAAAAAKSSRNMSPEARAALAEAGAKALQGCTPPGLQLERWRNSPPLQLSDLRGKVVLARWWTAGCPYCRNTAPSLRALAERYGARGLTVIGVYHHKEEGPFDPNTFEDTAREYQFAFPLAYDPDWRTFKSWMVDAERHPVDTGWTSLTFVLDKQGIIRHVHPGGEYVEGDAAYEKLTAVIDRLLQEKQESSALSAGPP